MKDAAAIIHRFTPARGRRKGRNDTRLRSLAIEQLCQTFPTGALALDAYCGVMFANREALDLLDRWHGGRMRPGGGETVGFPNLPPEIATACHRLKAGETSGGGIRARPRFGGRVFVRHPNNANLSAVVALERSPRDRRVAIFCVLLQDRLKDSLVAGRRDQLAMLTMAERRVAKLVADGMSNGDIASALGKSVTTVKSQLGTVFSKLELRSRTQLAALLRSA